jgi:hypothetical protein
MDHLPSVLIDQVAARVRGRIPEGLQSHLTQRLSEADLSPSNLGPGAILLVKHLALGTGTDWAVAARGDLATLVDRAVLPDRGIIPSGAEAVRFRDWSELLACLAMDLASNRARDRWWWRSILKRAPRWRGAPAGAALVWDPRVTPLVLSQLYGWGIAQSVLRSLPPAEIDEILALVLRAWGAPALGIELPRTRWNGVGQPERSADPVPGSGQVDPTRSPAPRLVEAGGAPAVEESPSPLGEHRAAVGHVDPPAIDPPAAPWNQVLALGEATLLTPAAEALLGTALLLARFPHRVRSARFIEALRVWAQAGAPLSAARPPVGGGPSPTTSSRPSVPEVAALATEPRRAERPLRPHLVSGESPVGSENRRDRTVGPAAAQEGECAPLSRTAGDSPLAEQVASSSMEPEGEGRSPGGAQIPAPELAPSPVVTGGVQTQYGGLFYLINLFQYLDLPDRFEEGWGLASRLSAWALLWAVVLSLLDGTAGPDPIWALLRDLDGSEPGALLGEGVRAEPGAAAGQEVTTPTDWGRVQSGFANPAEIPGPFHPDLRRFLAELMPGLTARLQGALPPETSIKELLTAPAEVILTGPHLDLRFPLEAISIPARMAGLDRDPGWTLAFGRVVTFHYV